MSTIRQAIYSYLSTNAGLQAAVGSNIFPVKMPQGASRPAIIYSRIKPGEAYNLQGSAERAVALFRFEVVADTYATADAVLTALNAAIGAINQTPVLGLTLMSSWTTDDGEEDAFIEPIDGGDTGVYSMTVNAEIMFVENVVNP